MKRVIRRNVFETNSSSTHSLTMVSKEDYDKWKKGEMYLNDGSFFTRKEAIEELKSDKWFIKYHPDFDFSDEDNNDELDDMLQENEFYTYDYFWDNRCEEYETFTRNHKTNSGEEIIAFGYYGYN